MEVWPSGLRHSPYHPFVRNFRDQIDDECGPADVDYRLINGYRACPSFYVAPFARSFLTTVSFCGPNDVGYRIILFQING